MYIVKIYNKFYNFQRMFKSLNKALKFIKSEKDINPKIKLNLIKIKGRG